MRTLVATLALMLAAGVADATQGCLNIISQQPVFCPKCSVPGASPGNAAKKISASLCVSCGFWCWATKTAEGHTFEFIALSEVEGAAAGIREQPPASAEAACLPSDVEEGRVLSEAIPVALHMDHADFLRLAADNPPAAAVIAMMLWRGDDASMTDARQFSAQFKGMPSYEDAVALFDDYEERVTGAWSVSFPRGAFLHVDVTGTQVSEDRVELAIHADKVTVKGRTPVGAPVAVTVMIGKQQFASSFGGKMVVSREAVATYP